MMKAKMSLDKARAIAQQVTIGRNKWGPQYSPQYSRDVLLEALERLEGGGNWDGPTKAELTKANRQVAACNARYERLKGRKPCEDAGLQIEQRVDNDVLQALDALDVKKDG